MSMLAWVLPSSEPSISAYVDLVFRQAKWAAASCSGRARHASASSDISTSMSPHCRMYLPRWLRADDGSSPMASRVESKNRRLLQKGTHLFSPRIITWVVDAGT
jgi:hypothetical protein